MRNEAFQVECRFVTSIVNSEELKLANTKSAQKEIRKNARRRARNRLIRARTRTLTKRAIAAIEEGAQNVDAELRKAQRELDSAARKGVIHKNAAARRKSRLIRRLRAKTQSA